MKIALWLMVLAASVCAAPKRLIYTKSFPASIPPFVFVCVDGDGSLQYKESQADDQPLTTRLDPSDVATLFDYAAKLNYFRTPIESGLKVANTGKKTFRYVDEQGNASETAFNYSAIPEAQQLLDGMERIAESERAYLDLDRTAHFDKLGVNDSLATIEDLWLKKQLAAPQQFVPLLNRVALHETYMHLARDRAARLKDAFSSAPPDASFLAHGTQP